MEGSIELAKRTGLIDPLHAQRLKEKHITGREGAIYRRAESRLDSDPEGVLRDLNSVPEVPATTGSGIERRSDGRSVLTTQSGAKFVVADSAAERFKGA